MFAQPNHDAAALQSELGDIPVAGFFAQGEFGPVGRQELRAWTYRQSYHPSRRRSTGGVNRIDCQDRRRKMTIVVRF